MLRYVFLSTSSIAPRFLEGLRASNAGTAVALSSRSLEKAKEKAATWGIPKAYGSHADLLADKDVDIVYISAVNAQHYPWAKAALEAGKHVVCEKPCTTSARETAELFALAREKGLFLMEAEKMLFLPAVLAAKEKMDAGVLGDIYMADMSHSFPASYNGWMFHASAGGGPLLSSGIYAVQLMLWLFGEIANISGAKSTLENGVEWQYILTGRTESGVQFTAKNSTRAVLDNSCRIFGTKGYLELPNYWKAQKVIFHIGGKEECLEFPCEYELMYEAKHIADCMEKGLLTSPVVTEKLSVSGIAAIEEVKKNW